MFPPLACMSCVEDFEQINFALKMILKAEAAVMVVMVTQSSITVIFLLLHTIIQIWHTWRSRIIYYFHPTKEYLYFIYDWSGLLGQKYAHFWVKPKAYFQEQGLNEYCWIVRNICLLFFSWDELNDWLISQQIGC